MTAGALGLAFLAGVLTVLSPCVLPLLPIVLGAAASQHRLGPLALAGGLALSFTAIGLFVATIGFAAGLDTGVFRTVSAVLLIGVGLVLLVPRLQEQFALAAAPVSNWAGGYADNFTPGGLGGQFGLGLLLGAVWSPCVGPTLGAASVLAAKGENLPQVALTMLAFGVGAGSPAAPARHPLARSVDALAQPADGRRQSGKDGARSYSCRCRASRRDRARQAPGGDPGRSLAGLADAIDDAVLTPHRFVMPAKAGIQ